MDKIKLFLLQQRFQILSDERVVIKMVKRIGGPSPIQINAPHPNPILPVFAHPHPVSFAFVPIPGA